MPITLSLIGSAKKKEQQTHPESSRDSSGLREKRTLVKYLTAEDRRTGFRTDETDLQSALYDSLQGKCHAYSEVCNYFIDL